MKVAIIDNRGGNVLRVEDGEQLFGSDLILYIQPDGHVDVEVPQIKDGPQGPLVLPATAVYIEAVHRDVISGEHSAEMNERRIDERSEVEASHSPAEKAAAAWSGPDSSGTETITGQL